MSLFKKKVVEKATTTTEDELEMGKKNMSKQRSVLIATLSIIFLIFQLYIGLIRPLNSIVSIPVHLCLALAITILYKPLADEYRNKFLWIIDGALLIGLAITVFYFISNLDRLIYRIMVVDPMLPIDLFCAYFMLVVIMEIDVEQWA